MYFTLWRQNKNTRILKLNWKASVVGKQIYRWRFHAWVHLSKVCPSGRGRRLVPGVWPKAWPSKNIELEIYLRTFCRNSNTINFNLVFHSSNSVGSPQMANFAPNETQRTCLGLPSLPYWVFLPRLPESVRADGWAHADVITEFSGINRFKADDNVYRFFRTIFRLAIPVFLRFTDVFCS